MAKTLEDYIYNPSLARFAQAMNLSMASLVAELSVVTGSDLKAAMDNARNAMEEFKNVPAPTLPPIRRPKVHRGKLAGHRGRNAAAPGRLNRRDPLASGSQRASLQINSSIDFEG